MTGKISRLPDAIREQLNIRLDNGEVGSTILKWLNSLPEVRDILKREFNGRPIDKYSLSEYRQRAFRKWQVRRDALRFSSQLPDPEPTPTSAHLLDRFVQWATLRLAAAAESSTPADDPQQELRELRLFLADIIPLRRSELISRRICLEEQRLQNANLKNQQQLEEQFWQWTKRPEIQAKLFPHRDPDKMRREVVRMLDRELLGVTPTPEPDPEPLCFI